MTYTYSTVGTVAPW